MLTFGFKVTRHVMTVCILASLYSLQGCGGGGDDGPPRASVSGSVTINGKPVEGLEVHFINPDYPNNGSFGVTDSEGKFKFVKGAVVGLNNVFFSKVEGGDPGILNEEGMDETQLEAMNAGQPRARKSETGPKQIVPAEYTAEASKLTFEVPSGGTSKANFEL